MGIENNIPEGWVDTTLDDICDKMYSGGTPSTKRDDYYGGNIPWIRTQEVKFNYILDTEIKITELGLKNSSARYIPKNTIIIAMYGNSAGRVAYSKIEATTNQACCNFVSDKEICDPSFVYFNLLGRYREIEGKANGAAQQNLSVGVLKELSINLPSLPEQKAIAKVLSAFDNKIELLQAQNKTLETMAQTIFKEWFGKYQIGDELPEGWGVGKLGDVAKHVKNNIKPFDSPNKLYHHYSLPAYDNGLRPVNELGSDIKSNKYSVENNSFLVSKLNPFTPRIWTIFNSEDVNICSTEFQVVKPNEDNLFSIVHCLLNSKYFTDNLSQKIKGTSSSHQRVNPEDIFEVDLVIPNKEDLIRFEKLVIPLITKKDINHNNIQSLTKTRDTLLPKLMSGQVRVNNTKQTVDA
jgi:type I restriction enzyme S subunit